MLTNARRTFTLALTLAAAATACAPTRSGPAGTDAKKPVQAQNASPNSNIPLPAAPSLADAQAIREKAAGILVSSASVETTSTTDPAANALRANAIEGLLPLPGRLEPVARAAFSDRSIGIRSVAAMAAGKARLRNLNDDAEKLLRDESPQVKAAAVFALQRNGGNVSGADQSILAVMLEGPDLRQRGLAAFILGELGNASATPMLMQALNAAVLRADQVQDRLVRLQIAEAICKLNNSRGKEADRAINEIRLALWPVKNDDLEPCALACQILGQLHDTESGPQLNALTSPNYEGGHPVPIEVRIAAGTALARMGSTRGVPQAMTALSDKSGSVRAMAAATLAETRNNVYLTTLSPLLDDADPQVRIAAAAAVIKITDAKW